MAKQRGRNTGKKHAPPKARNQDSNALREILEVLVPAFLLFLAIHFWIAEARYVPSPSMIPTIKEGDRFLVEKVTYRFRAPSRGEIVVFHPPAEAAQKAKQLGQQDEVRLNDFIKRIVALPGEEVSVREGRVYINGRALKEPYITPSRRPDYTYGPKKVPPGSYLVLGDNRNHSWDGHVWGFVPRQNIIGRAVWRFWPLNRIGILR